MRKNTRKTRRMKRRRGGATMQRERPKPSQAQPLTSTGGPDPNLEEIKRKMKYQEYALTVLYLKKFFEKESDLTPLKNMLTPVYDRPNGQIINFNEGTLSHIHVALTDFKDGKLDRFFDKIPPNSSKNKLFTFFDKKIKESTAELEKSIKNYKPLPTGSRRTPKQQQAYENMKKKSKSLSAAGRRGGKSRKSKRSRKKVKA